MNQLDAAIEDRLDPYIVIPNREELMNIWSKIMFPTIFRFLTANPTLVDTTVSPRHWMMVAEKAEDLVECKAEVGYIIQDIRTSFTDFDNVGLLLTTFLKTGNKEELRVILGRELVSYSSDHQLDRVEEKVTKWIKEDMRGLIGASNTDLIRTLGRMTEEEAKECPHLGKNVVRYLEILTKSNCHDMARTLMDAAYASDLRKSIIEMLKESKLMSKMAKRYKELKEAAAK